MVQHSNKTVLVVQDVLPDLVVSVAKLIDNCANYIFIQLEYTFALTYPVVNFRLLCTPTTVEQFVLVVVLGVSAARGLRTSNKVIYDVEVVVNHVST